MLHRQAPARDSLDLGCGVTRSYLGAPCYFYASISTLKYRSLCIISVTSANQQLATAMTQLQGHMMLTLHVKLMLEGREGETARCMCRRGYKHLGEICHSSTAPGIDDLLFRVSIYSLSCCIYYPSTDYNSAI